MYLHLHTDESNTVKTTLQKSNEWIRVLFLNIANANEQFDRNLSIHIYFWKKWQASIWITIEILIALNCENWLNAKWCDCKSGPSVCLPVCVPFGMQIKCHSFLFIVKYWHIFFIFRLPIFSGKRNLLIRNVCCRYWNII